MNDNPEDKVTNKIVRSILKFLRKELESETLSEGAIESIDVAIQCLESAYCTDQAMEIGHITPDLVELFCASDVWSDPSSRSITSQLSEETRAEAELLKNAGNQLMKQEKYIEAIQKYSSAISLDPTNAVYFCNRAAAQSKLNNHATAIEDCTRALQLDPTYSKAYGRLGIAYSSLNQHLEARNSYMKALELEPDNESYKNNLALTNEQLTKMAETSETRTVPTAAAANPTPFDFTMLMNNPVLMNMASQMLNNPNMQNIMSGLMTVGTGDPSFEALIQAGQQLAQQMQNMNPEFVALLRRQMENSGEGQGAPPQEEEPEDPTTKKNK